MPQRSPRVLVVVPAFNEEQAVGQVVREIGEVLPGIDCLVVNDGSSDATSAAARATGVTVLDLPFNLGVGGAMRAGFAYARNEGYDVVVQIDADGQHDPRCVPDLVASSADADIVIGARFAGTGEYSARGPRRWAMVMLAGVVSAIGKVRLTDATSGLKANGRRAIALFAEHYPAEYLGDTVEALVIAQKAGLRVSQLPVAMRPRLAGTPSHNAWKSTVYLGRACIALVFALIRPRVTVPEGNAS